MIRDLVDDGLLRINFRDETRERVAEGLTQVIEAAGEAAGEAALKRRSPPALEAPEAAPKTPESRARTRTQPRPPVRPRGGGEENRLTEDDDHDVQITGKD